MCILGEKHHEWGNSPLVLPVEDLWVHTCSGAFLVNISYNDFTMILRLCRKNEYWWQKLLQENELVRAWSKATVICLLMLLCLCVHHLSSSHLVYILVFTLPCRTLNLDQSAYIFAVCIIVSTSKLSLLHLPYLPRALAYMRISTVTHNYSNSYKSYRGTAKFATGHADTKQSWSVSRVLSRIYILGGKMSLGSARKGCYRRPQCLGGSGGMAPPQGKFWNLSLQNCLF